MAKSDWTIQGSYPVLRANIKKVKPKRGEMYSSRGGGGLPSNGGGAGTRFDRLGALVYNALRAAVGWSPNQAESVKYVDAGLAGLVSCEV